MSTSRISRFWSDFFELRRPWATVNRVWSVWRAKGEGRIWRGGQKYEPSTRFYDNFLQGDENRRWKKKNFNDVEQKTTKKKTFFYDERIFLLSSFSDVVTIKRGEVVSRLRKAVKMSRGEVLFKFENREKNKLDDSKRWATLTGSFSSAAPQLSIYRLSVRCIESKTAQLLCRF